MRYATERLLEEQAIGRGLIAAPLGAAAVGFVLSIRSIQMALVMAFLFGITATVLTVCLAYPLALLLRSRGAINPITTMVSGAALGNVPAAIGIIGTLVTTGSVQLGGFVRAIAAGSITGVAAAGAFWMVAGHHFARRQ